MLLFVVVVVLLVVLVVVFLKIIKQEAFQAIQMGMPNPVGMERSYHSVRNGMAIPFWLLLMLLLWPCLLLLVILNLVMVN